MTHGKRATYLKGCRCQPCAQAHDHYCKRYKLDYYRGYLRRRPVTPDERNILATFNKAGWSHHAIGQVIGVSDSTVRAIIHGEYANVGNDTLRDLHLLHHANYPNTSHLVPVFGTRRRLQALARMGHSSDVVSEASGLPRSQLNQARAGRNKRVRGYAAASVQSVYDDLWSTPGGCARVVNHAIRMKWAGPLAWDDDTIDDPASEPNNGHRTRGLAPKLPDPDILVAEVNRSGRRVVAERYGTTPDAVWARLNRAGYSASHTGDIHELPIYRKAAA